MSDGADQLAGLRAIVEGAAERERALTAALEALTGQLNQFTGTLATELRRSSEETLGRATAELADAGRVVGGARLDLVAEAIARVDARVAQFGTALGAQLRDVAAQRTPDPVAEEVARLRTAVEAVLDRADDPAGVDDLTARLAASVDGTAGLQRHLADTIDSLRADVGSLAAAQQRAEAALCDELRRIADGIRSDLRSELDALATAARPEQPSAGVALERALQALDALDALRLRPDPAPAIARLTDLVEALVNRPAPEPEREPDVVASGLSAGELSTALDELRAALTEGPALASAAAVVDVRAAVAAVATALAERPPATTADLAELRHAVEQLTDGPTVDRTSIELRLTDLRNDLAEVAATVGRLTAAGRTVVAPPALGVQVDAIGRLVHHAVQSLHAIEAATVGAGPRTERDRAAAAAALEELRAARS